MTTLLLNAKGKGVSPVGVLSVVLYAQKTLGSLSSHTPFAPSSQVLMILSKDRFVTSICPLACGWVSEE